MTGFITAEPGWMVYSLHSSAYAKPKRIYYRNHGHSYIKHDGMWVRVYFNHYRFEDVAEIQMVLNDGGEWEME